MNVNAWPKAASLVDTGVIHRGDRILRIEAPHHRPGLPAFVWTRAANATVRAQERRHEDDRCGQKPERKVYGKVPSALRTERYTR